MGPKDFREMRVLVIGLGRSGLAAAEILVQQGARVLVIDQNQSAELEERAQRLRSIGVEVSQGSHQTSDLDGKGLVVVSPGVPGHHFLLQEAQRVGLPIWSEVELALNLPDKAPYYMVAVTGTNGKTTTSRLVGEIFDAANKKVLVAGNIGFPLVEAVSGPDNEILVTEISSFQLEHTYSLHPQIAVLLNLSQDHLDWHKDYDSYLRAKHRLFQNQEPDDWAVVNHDDPRVRSLVSSIRSKIFPFSKTPLASGAFLEDGMMMLRSEAGEKAALIPAAELKLRGGHNIDNALAAAASCWLAGVSAVAIRQGLHRFTGLPHRLEYVATVGGVGYYNDSKATNPGATVGALSSFTEPVILLLGGRNKGNPFGLMAEEIASRARSVVLFGEAARELRVELGDKVQVLTGNTVEDAVGLAFAEGKEGDVVLLSPACASFDEFANYEERGDCFKKAVLALKDG